MEITSYCQSETIFRTCETRRFGVSVGPDSNLRGSRWWVEINLTFVPPISITSTFILGCGGSRNNARCANLDASARRLELRSRSIVQFKPVFSGRVATSPPQACVGTRLNCWSNTSTVLLFAVLSKRFSCWTLVLREQKQSSIRMFKRPFCREVNLSMPGLLFLSARLTGKGARAQGRKAEYNQKIQQIL